MSKDKIQNMDCTGCEQPALKCRKCIRKIMEYWDVEDLYTVDKIVGVLYEDGIYKGVEPLKKIDEGGDKLGEVGI